MTRNNVADASRGRSPRLSRRALAAFSLPLIAACGVMGGASAAQAAPGNIDPDQATSLTVHKYAQPDWSGEVGDGTELSAEELAAKGLSDLTPLQGVQFSAQPITSYAGEEIGDLGDFSDWENIPDLEDFVLNDAVFGAETYTSTSNAQGLAAFGDLPHGLYWVTETGDTGGNNITNPMKPFLVTLPLAGPDASGEWIYDAHVYPKNAVMTAEKSVSDDQALGLGDEITWSISTDVPYLQNGDQITRLVITDPLPAEVSYVSSQLRFVNSAGDTVTLDPSFYEITETNGTVVLTFTAVGLADLEANGQGGTVTLDIVTSVEEIGDGTIDNNATVNLGDAEVNVDAHTEWGALEIDKFAKAEDAAPGAVVDAVPDGVERLSGAEFQLFASQADAESLSNPITVDGSNTFVTDENGNVVVPGLKAEEGGTTYWLVETKAPAGYLLDETAYEVVIQPGSLTQAAYVAFGDEQQPASLLPRLGATGQAGAMLLGIGLAGGALIIGGSALMKRRKSENAA